MAACGSGDAPSDPGADAVGAETAAADATSDPGPPDVDLTGARNLPGEDRVAFYIGQETRTLRELHEAVYAASPVLPPPDGVTLYTGFAPANLAPNSAPAGATLYLQGIEGPLVDDLNGEVDFAATLARYDSLGGQVGLAVGLYLSDSWDACANVPMRALAGDGTAEDVAQWRDAMDRLIHWLRDQLRPVQLRIGYEFDGTWNCYEPVSYTAAFRYIKERIDSLGAINVATVWQSAAYPISQPAYPAFGGPAALRARLTQWYPGDDAVDWVGLSFFAGRQYLETQYSCPDPDKPWTIPDNPPRALQDVLADFAREHDKPLMIAEAAPAGFDLGAGTFSCVAQRLDHLPQNAFDSSSALFAAFFDDWFQWIGDNRDVVRMVAYINADWQTYPAFTCAAEATQCPGGYWGDTRLQADPEVLDAFGQRLRQPPFVAE